jgi:hypothetical protein
MSGLLLQVLIVVAFGAFCFGCGYLTAFIVTRNHWRDEMIKRGVARYNWQTGKWEWGEPPKEGRSRYWMSYPRRFPPPWSVEERQSCFIVKDGNGQALAYVYFEEEPGRRSAENLMSHDEAGALALNIAKLPDLLW